MDFIILYMVWPLVRLVIGESKLNLFFNGEKIQLIAGSPKWLKVIKLLIISGSAKK